jgi:urease gamma subunit
MPIIYAITVSALLADGTSGVTCHDGFCYK